MDQGKSRTKYEVSGTSSNPSGSSSTSSGTYSIPEYITVDRENLSPSFTCTICKKIFREATTINICFHTFCKDCIYQHFQEETKHCPVCNMDLGSTPQQFLRANEKLNHLASILFSPSHSGRNDVTSATSKLETTRPEATTARATGKETVQQGIDMMQKTKTKSHDGNTVAGIRGHLDLTTSHESSQQISAMMPEVTSNMSERNAHKDLFEAETISQVRRKKRTTKGRARSVSSSQKKGKGMIKHKNVEISLYGGSGFIDSGGSYHRPSSDEELADTEEIRSIWFHLVPHVNEKGHKDPGLTKSYIRVKNAADFTVLTLKKYLVAKLKLKSVSEVEVMCNGQQLDPSLFASSIVELWKASRYELEKETWDVEDVVVELAYTTSRKYGPQ